MIYNNLLTSPSFLQESAEVSKYIDTCFLTEGSTLGQLKNILDQAKKLAKQMQDESISEEDAKEELDAIYDQIKAFGAFTDKSMSAYLFMLFGTFVGSIMMACIDINAFVGLAGLALTIIASLVPFCVGFDYDKCYTILIKLESQMMMEKRKAKKVNDEQTEKKCDKVIAFVEDFKSRRRDEYKQYYQQQNESVILVESDKHELQINDFKQAIDEIDRYLRIAFDKYKLEATVTKFMIKKANSMNAKNKDKVLNEILDKAEQANKEYADMEIINVPLADSLIKKFDKFATKYSPFGMEAREKFEAKLKAFVEEIIDYINNFYDDISIEVMGEKGKQIKQISDTLYKKMRNDASVEAADKADRCIASWFNGSQDLAGFLMKEIQWANSMMKSDKIKKTLRYKIFSKIVK